MFQWSGGDVNDESMVVGMRRRKKKFVMIWWWWGWCWCDDGDNDMNFPSLWARSGNVFHGPPTTLTIAHFIVGNVSTVGVLPSGQLHIKTAGRDLLNAFYFPRKSLDFCATWRGLYLQVSWVFIGRRGVALAGQQDCQLDNLLILLMALLTQTEAETQLRLRDGSK